MSGDDPKPVNFLSRPEPEFDLEDWWRRVSAPQEIPWRFWVALPGIVAVSDLTLFRSLGYSGPATFLAVTSILLCFGSLVLQFRRTTLALIVLLWAVSARLAWCGSSLALVAGIVLLMAISLNLAGIAPSALALCLYPWQAMLSSVIAMFQQSRRIQTMGPRITPGALAIVIPAIAVLAFGSLFLLANPDLILRFQHGFERLWNAATEWLRHFNFSEGLFCLGSAVVGIGVLRNRFRNWLPATERPITAVSAGSLDVAVCRNLLLSVIVLFGLYLVFEFQTLWFRTFPAGFHYSGYAHRGAAWLTVALALATMILSVIFRRSLAHDLKRHRMFLYARIWSVENLLLAIAVFHRLWIYIGFNGMTRMRIVGILGVASVVGGFVLVLYKISAARSFGWMIRRQVWTVLFAIYLYTVLPVDAFVNWYNVRQIMSGHLAPSVQISEHPTSDEGLLQLLPLLNCPELPIRDGVAALLEARRLRLTTSDQSQSYPGESIRMTGDDFWQDSSPRQSAAPVRDHWTCFQGASLLLRHRWEQLAEPSYSDPVWRNKSLEKFHDFTYRWY